MIINVLKAVGLYWLTIILGLTLIGIALAL